MHGTHKGGTTGERKHTLYIAMHALLLLLLDEEEIIINQCVNAIVEKENKFSAIIARSCDTTDWVWEK